ncbi:MAG: hypothetical protein M1286_03705 [Candidatus Marsarchaeota archaeon]|nr:hypothetical protein [Candidatus Marsarchaeota archaeon]
MGRKNKRSANAGRRQYAFYLIEPGKNLNSDLFARKLICNKRVREVYVTEGACGFIVKAKIGDGREGPIPANLIGNGCRRVGLAISSYAYRKYAR